MSDAETTERRTRYEYADTDARFRAALGQLRGAARDAEWGPILDWDDRPQHELDAALDQARTHALDLARRLIDAAIADERAHTAAVRARTEATR